VLRVSNRLFQDLADEAFNELVKSHHLEDMKDVFITWRHRPTAQQSAPLEAGPGQQPRLLLGIYEGVPATMRWQRFATPLLPSKITLFKDNILAVVGDDFGKLRYQIKKTLWHEIAHHMGLDHDQIHQLEENCLARHPI